MADIAAIVLAAGRSERYGSNKMLVLVDGTPLVSRTVDVVLASGIGRVTVVLGHQADLVQNALENRPVTTITNPGHDQGMGGSIAVGVQSAGPGADGFLIVLADMPGLVSPTLSRIVEAFRDARSDAAIVAPTSGDRLGNPVLFGSAYFAELIALSGDEGARKIVAANRTRVRTVLVPAGELEDMDEPLNPLCGP